jgi:predicted negative regulator of RcsB-dependent stress response
VDVYNTEEEQVQAIKQWWKENAVSLIAGIVIGLAVLGGYRFWTETKNTQAQEASVLYSEILSSANDKAKNVEILKADYSGTPYAALAALLLAKDNVNANEVEKAISQLKWIIDNNNDNGIQHIAQQRLARVYLSQNNIESAETLIKGLKASGFDAAYNEIRGDLNLAKKLPVQAKENYRLALAALVQGDQRYAIIKMKLDDLTQIKTTVVENGNKSDEVKSK